MSREHAIMCRNKQEIVQKGKNEANMPCHYKRKQASSKPGEITCNPSSENQREQQKPTQPRAVQLSKRRQSGKRPAGDGADLVGV